MMNNPALFRPIVKSATGFCLVTMLVGSIQDTSQSSSDYFADIGIENLSSVKCNLVESDINRKVFHLNTNIGSNEYTVQGDRNAHLAFVKTALSRILGKSSEGRLNDILSLNDGWNFGDGKALSLGSISLAYVTLADIGRELTSVQSSIFMSNDGELEILIEKSQNVEVFFRFQSDHILLIDCTSGEEKILSPSDASCRIHSFIS